MSARRGRIFDSDFRYGGNVVDPFQWQTKERGNSSLDVRHRFVFNSLVELPFGRGHMFGHEWNAATNALLGGWQMSSIVTLASGSPIDIQCNYCSSPSTRPDLVGPLHQLNNLQEWFDTSSFQRVQTVNLGPPPNPTSNNPIHAGTTPRNPFTGPVMKVVNLTFSKNFAIAERFRLTFNGDFFNLFNTPQFSQPDGNLNDGNFGRITSLGFDSQREIQLSLRVSF
jgi:hypothetical protein